MTMTFPLARLWLLPLLACQVSAADPADTFGATTETVGRHAAGLVSPVNQLVTPAGTLVELPDIGPMRWR